MGTDAQLNEMSAFVNIKQIRYFVSTVERGSLSAAAKDHYVTVQTLSKSLGDLEKELGESLFIRKSHGVSPTLLGVAFYQESKMALKWFEKLEAFARAEHRDVQLTQNGELNLALVAPPFYRYSSACDKLAAFAKRSMGIEATVSLASAGEGLNRLRTGELDALITLGPLMHKEIRCVRVGTAPLGVLMATNHPLKDVEEVHLADLKRYPLLTAGGFELFNDNFVSSYGERGLEVECKHVGLMDVVRFVFKKKGLVFAVGIPALGGMLSGTIMKLVAPEDAYPVPLCLASLKTCANPAYFAFEHNLANRPITLAEAELL